MIKTILFDLDGTLLDTKEIIIKTIEDVFTEHLQIEKPDYQELVNIFIGPPLKESFKKYLESDEEITEAILQFRKFNQKYHDSLIKPYDQALKTLIYLKKRKIKIGIVSSKLHQAVKRGLELTGLLPYVDVIVGLDDAIEHKPSPIPVLKALELLQAEPQKTVFVGDHPNDLIAAKKARVLTCAVTYSDFLSELLAVGPDFVIDELANLKDLV